MTVPSRPKEPHEMGPAAGSEALLRALWREHPRILVRLAMQGRQVVRP